MFNALSASPQMQFVTVTGADDNTDIGWMLDMAERYHRVEWGILIGGKPRAKFPTAAWIDRLIQHADGAMAGLNLSLHVCGDLLTSLFEPTYKKWYQDGLIPGITKNSMLTFQRLQLNCSRMEVDDFDRFRASDRLVGYWTKHGAALEVIIQQGQVEVQPRTECEYAWKNSGCPSLLFDRSGGRGTLPDSWPEGRSDFKCGWAGGLSAESLPGQLPSIYAAAKGKQFWIDAEGQLRSDRDGVSQLDPRKVEAYLCEAHMYKPEV